jgi:hypothetical protein
MSGITDEGFEPKILREILSEIETEQLELVSPQLDVSEDSPDGQRNGVVARQAALAWEVLQLAYSGHDPDKAEGDRLIAIGKLTGTRPEAASASSVIATVNLDSGTVLVAGTHMAHVDGKPDVLFTPAEDYTATATGDVDLTFVAVEVGEVAAASGTLVVIATPITGWNSITNDEDATLGNLGDYRADGSFNNESFRARRVNELAAAGSTTARAIAADLSQLEDEDGNRNVLAVTVLNNVTDGYVDNVPPHAFEAIVYDAPEFDDDLIGQSIFENQPAGGRSFGSIQATAVDPDDGSEHAVWFSRPDSVDIYLAYTLTVDEDTYVGDAAFELAVVTFMRALVEGGSDVLYWHALQAANQGGVLNADVTLGFTASPVGTADLTIGTREIAAFDTSRITVA